MSAAFPLAGLLRLRKVQEDQAAGGFAAANARAQHTRARLVRTRDDLAETTSAPVDTATLHALVAARAAAQSQLADLAHTLAAEHASAAQARAELDAARSATGALEKLEERHRLEATAQELRVEQVQLDERSVQEWHRERGSER